MSAKYVWDREKQKMVSVDSEKREADPFMDCPKIKKARGEALKATDGLKKEKSAVSGNNNQGVTSGDSN